MKKAVRLNITGNLQSLFFRQFIKEHAEKCNMKGYLRILEDGKVEIFLQGEHEELEDMINICKAGPKHSVIRNVDVKEERLQDFKDFKVLNF